MLHMTGSKAFGSQHSPNRHVANTVRVLVSDCSFNSRNTCFSNSGVLILLVRLVLCIPLTNESVSVRNRCKCSKGFRFGKRLDGNRSPPHAIAGPPGHSHPQRRK
ncbi:hypothetical protein TNIN_242661 [Trichonephila inaurata madagascariensis]|uniref:Uncharacterized protein n=1 Tax=Trichonephila inaurata madagascariensis TaxID=2747483 RepID=A0A8X7C9N3_9ARAC|nr:hypothetical protein TNIN_242661 [Trichonephila inaurata madagascariensis]